MSDSNHGDTKQETCRPVYVVQEPYSSDDEIDLLDLAAVLWRRRWFMVLFTSALTGLAVAYCLWATPVYEVRALLAPGIAGFNFETGKPEYAPTNKEMEEWFNQRGYVSGLTHEDVAKGIEPGSLSIAADLPRNGQYVRISMKTPDPDTGRAVLSTVIDMVGRDNELLRLGRENIQRSITDLEQDLANWDIKEDRLKNEIKSMRNEIAVSFVQATALGKDIEARKAAMARVQEQIEAVNLNSRELMQQRDDMLKSRQSQDNDLALLMYTNTIQQNISYVSNLEQRLDTLMAGLNDLEVQKERLESAIKTMEMNVRDKEVNQTRELAAEKEEHVRRLQLLKTRLEQLTPVTVVQKPTVSSGPVSPARKKIVSLAFVGSAFISVFLAFMLEFWIKNRERIQEKA